MISFRFQATATEDRPDLQRELPTSTATTSRSRQFQFNLKIISRIE
jgi:hypothetical protein